MKVKSYYTDANVNGSCRQGSVFTTYQILKDILGEPQYTDADPLEKVSCEWTLKAEVVFVPSSQGSDRSSYGTKNC